MGVALKNDDKKLLTANEKSSLLVPTLQLLSKHFYQTDYEFISYVYKSIVVTKSSQQTLHSDEVLSNSDAKI